MFKHDCSTSISMFAAVLSSTKTLSVKTRGIFAGECLHIVICKAFRAWHGSKLLSYLMLLFVDYRSSQSLERQYRSYSITFGAIKVSTKNKHNKCVYSKHISQSLLEGLLLIQCCRIQSGYPSRNLCLALGGGTKERRDIFQLIGQH